MPEMIALSGNERCWPMMSLCSMQLFSTCNSQPYSPKRLPGKFVPQLLHTGLSGLFSPVFLLAPLEEGCEIYFLLSSETYL